MAILATGSGTAESGAAIRTLSARATRLHNENLASKQTKMRPGRKRLGTEQSATGTEAGGGRGDALYR